MTAIPNRAVFRSQEVCEIAEVQPYVLRSWEAEFPDLGLSKGAGAPRVYRRGDVERVLRLKHLLFVEGLTLAGARRQLSEEDPSGAVVESGSDDNVPDAAVAELLDREVRKTLGQVRTGLTGILGVLSGVRDTAPIRLVSARPMKKKAGRGARPKPAKAAARRAARTQPRRAAKSSPATKKSAKRRR